MKRLIYILFAFVLFGCSKTDPLSMQQTGYFIKFFGGPFSDEGHDIRQTNDGGYVILGSTTSEDDDLDIILIKTDKYGNPEWQKTFGDTLNDEGYSIQVTSDNGYIILGSYAHSLINSDMYLIKTDAGGEIIWENKIGGDFFEEGLCVRETNDGGFILVGSTNEENLWNGNPQGEKDIFLVKTNANGDSLWSKSFGGVLSETGISVIQKPDNGYLLLGSTTSFYEPNQSGSNIIVIETNGNGVQIDKLTYGGNDNDYGCSIEALSDGYLILGTTNSFGGNESDVYCIRTTTNIHSITWTKTYGGEKAEVAGNIIKAGDGSFVISGGTESYGEGNMDSYIIQIDNNGNEIRHNNYGGEGNELANSIIQTNDDGFAIIGSTGFEENSMISLTKINNSFELK